jgi:hypothetical protein
VARQRSQPAAIVCGVGLAPCSIHCISASGAAASSGGAVCGSQWAALVQAGALLINHIAPGNRTLAPSA